jgi:hypothetical protein
MMLYTLPEVKHLLVGGQADFFCCRSWVGYNGSVYPPPFPNWKNWTWFKRLSIWKLCKDTMKALSLIVLHVNWTRQMSEADMVHLRTLTMFRRFEYRYMSNVICTPLIWEQSWIAVKAVGCRELCCVQPYVAGAECTISPPWNWALLENSVIIQLLKKFWAFYGARSFITVFATHRHWSPIMSQIQPASQHPSCFFKIRDIILPFTLRSSLWSVLVFQPNSCRHISSCCAFQWPFHLIIYYFSSRSVYQPFVYTTICLYGLIQSLASVWYDSKWPTFESLWAAIRNIDCNQFL